MSTLSGREVADAGLVDWSYLRDGLQTRLLTNDFATGLRLVARIGATAEAAGHHPDVDLRYPHVDIQLTSHDVSGVTERDVSLARTISEIASAEGVAAAPRTIALLELALDTPDAGTVRPFWRAVLDMSEVDVPGQEPDLRAERLPTLWFQPSGRDEPRQRFHLDLWVSPDVVEDRISSAVAAGGTLVSDADSPAFWVLADPDGNKVCLCTWRSRDPEWRTHLRPAARDTGIRQRRGEEAPRAGGDATGGGVYAR